MSEENNTNTMPTGRQEYVTEEYLDKRLTENNQVLLGALDAVMEKRTKEVREELYIVRNELKEEMDKNTEELKRNINNVQELIDGYVKAQEDFKKDFVIIKEEVRQIKEIIKEKLGLEIRVI